MAREERLVGRWMSKKLHTAQPEDPVVDAFEVMTENRIRHLPIVEGGKKGAKKLVGIVSDRDIRAFFPKKAQIRDGAVDAGPMSTPLARIMTKKVHTVTPETTVREASEILVREKISALPVLEDGALVGIISSEDLLWAFVETQAAADGDEG